MFPPSRISSIWGKIEQISKELSFLIYPMHTPEVLTFKLGVLYVCIHIYRNSKPRRAVEGT